MTKQKTDKVIIEVIFADNRFRCWKFKFDMVKIRLDEILICLEKQYKLK